MEEAFMIHSGRRFSQADIRAVGQVARECPDLPVSRLAEAVCGMLGWETPSGKAKLNLCLGLLRRLDSAGMISLPRNRSRKPARAQARRLMPGAPGPSPPWTRAPWGPWGKSRWSPRARGRISTCGPRWPGPPQAGVRTNLRGQAALPREVGGQGAGLPVILRIGLGA
jgi:hypothetical protein